MVDSSVAPSTVVDDRILKTPQVSASTQMAIPNLNRYGFLEVGTHKTSFQEIQNKFVHGDPLRQQLWLQFLDLFKNIEAARAFQALEFFGSFFSSKETPDDIDLALELRAVESPNPLVEHFFKRQAMKDQYCVDLLVKETNASPYRLLAPRGYEFATNSLHAFRRLKRSQFQAVIKIDRQLRCLTDEYKGVLRVELQND